MEMESRNLIEIDFPLKEVSEESVKEKNIRHGHISTLHIWWARRPLAASRATIFAALTPAPASRDRLVGKLKFIAELSMWENSLNMRLLEKARQEIKNSFGGKVPKVLDCFAGGGAIPLEALRLGCETHALEYNPVAVLILKAILEYPQNFGEGKNKYNYEFDSKGISLVEAVKKWSIWVFEAVKKEIGKFYPPDSDGSIPIGYTWARTIKCQNPLCGAEIPLLRQLWLAKKKNKRIALKIIADKDNKKIDFRIVEGKEINFDPTQGTTRGATVLCPICGAGIDPKTIRREARAGRMGQRQIATILQKPKGKGKTYRTANKIDSEAYEQAEKYLQEVIQNLKWDCNPIPDEELPPTGTLGFRVQRYGIRRWGDLFNSRQKLAHILFVEKIKLAYQRMIEEGYDAQFAKAVITYLALGISRLTDRNSTLCRVIPQTEAIGFTFGRNALPMLWDYIEMNPLSHPSSWAFAILEELISNIKHLSLSSELPGQAIHGTATRLPYSSNFFDAVITDPPYYDNVPYSDLSDFHYVWLKRTIGKLYPELFSTPLTPKSQEIVMHPSRHDNNLEKAKRFFEDMLTQSFKEIYRVLKDDGIAVIVFAYKSTEAWETIINSLLKSGLVLTASWPIHTEMKARLRAIESAALASSVYMVCRKRTEVKTIYFNDIRTEIENRIKEKLAQFWEQGISGADFFVSAIGPAVEVFGRYSKVEKLSGEEVSVQELLEYVRKIVSEFALERVLKRADLGGVDAETRFYLLWRWTFGNAKVHFDDAIKLSRPMGVELTQLWDGGSLVKKEKEFVRVLTPQERAKDPAFLKKTKLTSMIDVLHYVLALWERGEREKIKEILNETGYAGNEIFWQTAQAISEILPQGDKEKQLLQGFLYGKEVYVKEARGKTSLFDYMESK
jgi:adenine-specific DNA methylase